MKNFFSALFGKHDDDDEDDENENEVIENNSDEESDGDSPGITFSFSFDEDGELLPDIECPKCHREDNECINSDSDTYKCNVCGHQFIPDIYKPLDSAKAYVDRANKKDDEGYKKLALRDCDAAIELDPNIYEAFLLRGYILTGMENWTEAEKALSEAIRLNPKSGGSFHQRGKARFHLGNLDGALDDFSQAIRIDPQMAISIDGRANILVLKKDYAGAIRDFSESIRLIPDVSNSYLGRGYTYQITGNLEAALADYNKAINLDPSDFSVYFRRAEVHELMGNYKDALSDYKNSLRAGGDQSDIAPEVSQKINELQLRLDPNADLEPFDPDAEVPVWEDVTLDKETKEWRSIDRGTEMLESGDLDGAYKEFSSFIQHVPNRVPAYIYRSCTSYQRGDLEEVLKDLTGAIECGADIYEEKGMFSNETDPRYDSIYLLRGMVYELMGKEDKALADFIQHIREDLERSYRSSVWHRSTSQLTAPDVAANVFLKYVDIKPHDANTNFVKGLILLLQDDKREAIDYIDKAIAKDPKNPSYFWCRALCHYESDETIEDFEKAISIKGNRPEYYFICGLKRLLVNDTEKGQEDILKAIELDPTKSEFHEKLGVFMVKSADYETAIDHLSKAITINPELRDAYYYRGISYEWINDIQAAKVDLQRAIELEDQKGYAKTHEIQEKFDEILKAEESKKVKRAKLTGDFKRLRTAKEYIERGETSLLKSDWDNAILDFEEALNLEPGNSDAYRHRGMTNYKMGDFKSAIKDYNQAIKLDPKNSDLFLNRGILIAESGDTDNAIKDFTEAIRLNPTNQLAFHMRALAYGESWFDGESIDKALEDYEEAIRLDPNDGEVFFSRAKLWRQPVFIDTQDNALADCDEAIRLDPNKAEYFLLRGKIKIEKQDANGATEDYFKAAVLDPNNEEVQTLLRQMSKVKPNKIIEDDQPTEEGIFKKYQSDLHAQRGMKSLEAGDYYDAIEAFTEAIRLTPENHLLHTHRGNVYNVTGQYQEAFKDFSEAIRLGSDTPITYIIRGTILLREKDFENALIDLDKAVQLDPQKEEAYQIRVLIHKELGNSDKAISDYSKVINFIPDQADNYLERGQILLNTDYYVSAISDIQTFLDLSNRGEVAVGELESHIKELQEKIYQDDYHDPSTETIFEPKKLELVQKHLELGVKAYEMKDFDRAIREYQLAANINPNEIQAFEFSSLIHIQQEEWENAIRSLTSAIRLNPGYSDGYLNRGVAYFNLGKIEEGEQDMENALLYKPDYFDAHLNLAASCLMKKNTDKALFHLDKALHINPGDATAYLYRANAHEQKKDYRAAISDLQRYCELGGAPGKNSVAQIREHIKNLREEYHL